LLVQLSICLSICLPLQLTPLRINVCKVYSPGVKCVSSLFITVWCKSNYGWLFYINNFSTCFSYFFLSDPNHDKRCLCTIPGKNLNP
jgi:hypothetical protein